MLPLGAVLSGGRSSRMGHDKALAHVGDATMAEHVAAALRAVCDPVVTVGRSEPVADMEAFPDPGGRYQGPLAGLVAALRQAEGGWVALVAVDQPWVDPTTISRLADRADRLPIVPVDDGVRQTTCALYPAAVLEEAEEELEAGGSIQTLLDRVAFDPVVEDEWRSWGEDGRSWFSADTPDAIDEGRRRFGEPGS
jgi:molybdopterin-guanine dinucleotide biosynthesis protein A